MAKYPSFQRKDYVHVGTLSLHQIELDIKTSIFRDNKASLEYEIQKLKKTKFNNFMFYVKS